MSADTGLGTVAVLRRYPVKSMLGEDLTDGEVTVAGLAGDRVLGLVHRETGKIASAKNPRQWRRLLKLGAAISAMDDFAPQPCAGVYAQVLRPGLVRLGDVARPA